MADRMPDNTPHVWRGPRAAAFYVANGLRVLPLSPETKEGARKGFGKAFPDFCTPPNQFRPEELVAILTGPCPLGKHAGGRLLCGLDLDAPFDRTALETACGPLPDTLSSKNGRHLYYWITPEQQARGELTQGNDVFKTKASGAGALDLRPAAGGYFLERGDWDGNFDRTRIRDLPDRAFDTLLTARSRGRGRPPTPCPISLNDYEGPGESPMARLGEVVLDMAARELASIWPKPGQGGGHDLALALGGIMADAYGSIDDVCDFCARVFHYAQAPDACAEVVTSLEKRRAGILTAVFGWPTLRRMLIAANPGLPPAIVDAHLKQFKARIPGLNPTVSGLAGASRAEMVKAFNAAGCPGLSTDPNAFKTFCRNMAKAPKQTAPVAETTGAANLTTNQEES
jgi:hypothetical protein